MLSMLSAILFLTVGFGATGCSVTGTWNRIESSPNNPPGRFILSTVTFAEDGRFTATESDNGRRRTLTGAYRFDGSTLLLEPADQPSHRLPARLDNEQTLVIQYDPDDANATIVKVTLKKISP
jgi:hypothetical protein